MKKTDIIVIVFVLVVEAMLFIYIFNNFENSIGENRHVEMYVNNQLIFSKKVTEETEEK